MYTIEKREHLDEKYQEIFGIWSAQNTNCQT